MRIVWKPGKFSFGECLQGPVELNTQMVLKDPTSRNLWGLNQVNMKAWQFSHLCLSTDQESFDSSTFNNEIEVCKNAITNELQCLMND
jgi:hypothetical protein